jgi:hypothetical protein
MCVVCDLASAEGGTSRVFAANTAPRRASPAKEKAQRLAAAAAIPKGVGDKGRRTLIKGGTILSMDQRVGNHARGDVLIEGSTIAEVARSISAPDAVVIDAAGHIVMDISQIHHSPEHSDAVIEGLRAGGRRAVFGYFEGWGEKAKCKKWRGAIVGYDIPKLRVVLTASRDYVFAAAGIEQNLFGA